MSLSWEYYVSRRGIIVEKFLADNNIENYDQFCAVLKKFDLQPPARETVAHHFHVERKKPEQTKVKSKSSNSVRAKIREKAKAKAKPQQTEKASEKS